MGLGSNGILKISLWLQAYAILVGMWMLLAALHVMTVLNMVTTPEELMDPVLILGQKIVDNETDPLKTVVPVLYGVQGVAWCTSLICVMCLRSDDPTLGFEIQDPEKKSGVHTLDIRQSMEGKKWSTRMSQRFFSIGQSTVAPLDYNEITAKRGQEKEGDRMTTRLEQQHEFQPPCYKTQEPQAAWTRDERRASNDSDSTYIPKAHPIPQVVVTFGDDKTHDHPWNQLQQPTDLKSAMVKADEIEVRTTFVNNTSYGLGGILFDKPGESLSDIIFKAVQPLHVGVVHKKTDKAGTVKDPAGRISNDSESTDGDTKAESPSLSAVTTLNDYMISDHECGDELQSRDVSVTPESPIVFSRDQSEDIEQCRRQNQQQYRSEFEKSENIRTFSPIKNASQPIVPERRSSVSYGQESYSDMEVASHGHYSRSGYPNVTPRVQPNSSDSPHSTNVQCIVDQYQDSNFSAYDQDYEQSSPSTKSKPSLSSLQYWKNRNSRDNNNTNEPTPSSPSPTSAAFNLVNNITKKKKQTPASSPEPKTPTLTVPTIVLHPDDEDNEPVRVLSDMDIEYLSTMPPVPLRPLAEEWDEFDEDDYYDDDGNDGYDYDDYHPKYAYTHEEEDIGEEEEDDDTQYQMPKNTNVEGEYDPYALDVPINLEIDLQGLEQGDIISSY
ncbi:hypothetical protein BGZ80_008164 [Entomortierella chlamydospora]|uniref:Uncharacterized protein n=1 Tax=Entomortierella chlamydospora TaxID=101097 RepID=A0A9P6MYX6_9FUNG|nr:hypothetical protein BGZ80_008164 [Entomortierella chlamydospora]